MAKIAKPTVPMKMYRRFAAITITLAVLLAVFADSGNRDAMADGIAEQERQAELQRISDARTSGPKLTRRDPNADNRFGGGDAETFGAPMEQVSVSSRSTTRPPMSAGSTRNGETLIIPGYSKAYLDSLSEEEYRRLVSSLQAAGAFSDEVRERNLANIERISSQRSGVATPSEGLVN